MRGNSGGLFCVSWFLFVLFCGYLPALAQTPYSLVKGSVFAPDGRAFGGAKVTAIRIDVDAKQQKKTKRESFSDRFGEFAFRLDTGPAKYRLTIEAKGYTKHEREVEVSGDERQDISIVLKK